jgi:hypothetical protein
MIFYWDDAGESNGISAFDVFRVLLNKLSRESRFDDETFDSIDGEENVE